MVILQRLIQALLLACIVAILPAQASESISLQLRWKHAFQFAGYYQAIEQGYYKEQGLNVSLIEGGPGKYPVSHVTGGTGRYGISDSGIIITRAKGVPVKALAVVFQHSPLVLAVRKDSGISTFSDLNGKRVMLQQDNLDAVIIAAMHLSGLNSGDFIRQDTSFNLQDLVDGKTDAFSVYLTDQPHQLQELGVPYRLLNPLDFGIDFYGDLIFTSEEEVNQNPARALAFTQASLRGWEYALNHIDETIRLIMKQYNSQHLSRKQLEFEAYKTREIIVRDVVIPGYMNPARWQKIVQYYADMQLIRPDFPVNELLFVPQPSFAEFINQNRWYLAVFTLIALLLISAVQSLLLRRIIRRRTRELQTSETRYRTLVGNLPGIIFRSRTNTHDVMDFISQEAERVTGYPAADFLTGEQRSFSSIVHPDDRQQLQTTIAAAVQSHHNYTIEYRIIHANGSTRWLHERGQPMRDEKDGSQWLDGNIFDITERKLDEQVRDGISEALEMMIQETDQQRILEKIVHIYETRYADMRGSILLLRNGQLYHGAGPSLPESYIKALDGIPIGPTVGSCGTAASTGKRVIVEDIDTDPLWAPYKSLALPHGLRACWSEPILNSSNQVLGTFAMYYDEVRGPDAGQLHDITNAARLAGIAIEREHNSEQLEKLQRAIEHSSEVVTIMNRDSTIEYVNEAFTRITGFPRDQAIGKSPHLLNDPSQKQQVEQMWLNLHRGESWQGRVIEQKQDGSTYPAMLSISPVLDKQGEITHYIAVHEDLTRLQEMEDQFRQAQKMEAVGTLVGGIAHDFNNLLAAVQGNTYLLSKQLTEMPLALDRVKNIENLNTTASSMIRQLLTFARKDSVAMQEIGINDFLKEAFRLAEASIPENIQRNLSICDEEIYIRGDATQLQQVLMNLLINARDAIEEIKHPRISCSLETFTADNAFLLRNPEITGRNFAHLVISDNGHGIPAHIADKIFEPFFTTKETGKGSGLGLAMVYGAIKTHEGTIEIESKPYKGTSFHIYLPTLAHTSTTTAQEQASISHGDQETILLVDDDDSIRTVTCDVLESLNYRIVQCDNGEKALKLYKQNPEEIALIFTDVVMPVMGGIELAANVRQINANVPVLFATGYDPERTFANRGLPKHSLTLHKPFSIESLSDAVTSLLHPKT